MQHCEVTMVNAHFSRVVAHLESREGCPVTPGASLTKVFRLCPSAACNKDKRGIALDGHFQVNQNSCVYVPKLGAFGVRESSAYLEKHGLLLETNLHMMYLQCMISFIRDMNSDTLGVLTFRVDSGRDVPRLLCWTGA